MTEILFIGRDDKAEALVQAALAPDNHTLHRVHSVADASNLLAEQRFEILIIDFDDAAQGPGFDLAQLLGLFLFLPTIALFPEDADDADELMRYADAAMYQAKQAGGECYQFYRPDMNSAALRRIGLGVALQRAIRDNEFELHYQPQIDLKTGLAVGLEALVRWWHPECGLILPDQFIPLAEELA